MKLGNNDVQYVYLGNTQVRKIFLGTDEVWTPKEFEFTINTANISTGGTQLDTQFKLPLTTSTGLDCLVEWGDGSSDIITNHLAPEVTHTYASSGTYTVKITGKLLGWQFANTGDRLKMLNVSQWAGLNISVNAGFHGCTNMTCTATDAPIITSTDLTNYFRFCTNFNGAIGNWNVGTVTTMFIMFADAISFNQPIGNWNVSNVTNMRAMFENAPSFNQNIGAWNVSKVINFQNMFFNATAFNNNDSDDIDDWIFSTTSDINMVAMFSGSNTTLSCKFNRYIGSWKTERVTSMGGMFANNTAFNQNIGAWDVSKVTSFTSMFNDATAFNNGNSDSIKNWSINTVSLVNMDGMFRGSNTTLSNKFNQPIGDWNTSSVSSMAFMFSENTAFNQPIGNWNTSQVTSMAGMFRNTSFTQDINTKVVNIGLPNEYIAWNTSNVTSMVEMFNGASSFNQNIGAWNVSKVTSFVSMFSNATAFNNNDSDDIDDWIFSTTSDINMQQMFGGSNTTLSCKFNRYIGSWNTERVTNMSSMFVQNTAFNQDIGAWNVQNVTNFGDMFFNARLFNNANSSNINNWIFSTTSTINMSGMFRSDQGSGINKNTFNQPIGSWNTERVTNMSNMFVRCRLFNQDIGSWITNNVTDMNNMFNGALVFNQDISNWNVSNVANFTDFMEGKSAANYDAQFLSNIYEKWSLLTLVPNLNVNFGSIQYNTSGAIGKNRLLNAPNNWVLSDGGQEAPFEFTVKTDNAGVSTSTQFRMPLTTSTNLGFTVNWGDGSPLETITDHTLAIHTYASAGTYNVSVTGAILGWRFNNGGDRLKMLDVIKWAGLNISVNNGFWGCTNLTASAIDAPLITSTGLQIYFGGCSNFNGAIGNWDVSNVTSMSDMFFGASAFNQNIGAWNTGNVTNMNSMLRNTTLFNQNIGSWNTGNVTDMNAMFNSAAAFNQNIGAWDVSKVTDFSNMFFSSGFNNGGLSDINNWTLNTTSNIVMENMFRGCPFNQNIGSWNTQRVTSLRLMFFGNFSFNQNIGSWDTSNVTNMSSMFNGATAFNQDIGGWNVSNVTNFTSFMAGKTAADYSAANLDSIYNGWSSLPSLQPNINISFGSIAYTSQSQAGKDILTNAPNNWVITDGSVAFQYTADVSVAGTSGVGFFQLPLVSDGNTINSIVDWGDGTTSAVTAFNDVDTLHDYNVTTGAAGLKTITISGLFSGWQFNDGGDKLKMRNVSSWGALKISVEAGFFGCANMTGTATDVPTITTTSLAYYFESTKFNGELNYWDVSGVSIFLRMFRLNLQFNQPLNLWDMSNATNLQTMLGVTNFNQNVNSWNVSKVTNFTNTFAYSNFNQPLDLWVLNTLEPINMTGMFENNPSFNRDISSWNTIAVTSMRYMFIGASAFNQNIGLWNVSNVTLMEFMFQSATAFNQDIGGWDISNVTNFTGFMANKTAANYSAANLSSIYDQWSTRPVKPNLSINFGTIDYFAASEPNKLILTSAPNLWTIIDGNPI